MSRKFFMYPSPWPHSAVVAACLWPMAIAHAQQPPIDAGALQRNLENQSPLPPPLGLKAPMTPPAQDTAPPQEGETIVTVSRFEWEGVKRFDADELRQLLQAYLQKPLTLQDLQQACSVIEKRYSDSGYLAQVTVPPQTVQDGVLTLNVTEAILGQVHVDTSESENRFGAERAASYIAWANMPGQALSLHDITRALIILNETPGVSVTSAMEPGAKDGETDLRLTLKESTSYVASLEANNMGSRTTGLAQVNAQATLNNPLGHGDMLAASGIYSEGSTYTQAAYYLPVLPNGLRGGFSGSALSYRNVPAFQANGGYGQAYTQSVSLAYPLLRSVEANANASVRYDRKTYTNHLIATDAISSSYHIHNLNVGLTGNQEGGFLGDASHSGQVNLVLGQLQLQSDNPSNYGVHTPGHFFKINFSGNRVQTLVPGVSSLFLSVSGQLADENLNSSEQFYLGGPYGVRAYPMSQGGGAQGVLATVEYQHKLDEDLQGIVFLDTGKVQQYIHTYANWQGNTHAANRYSLHGAGVGFKWRSMGVNISATLAWKLNANPLYNQQGQAVDVDNQSNNVRGWLTASYNF